MRNVLNGERVTKRTLEELEREYNAGMKTDFSLLEEVEKILREVGVPIRIFGYQYLRSAIIITVNDRRATKDMMDKMYPAIAQIYKTTLTAVERGIRYAIAMTWHSGNHEMLNSLFGNSVKKKISRVTNTRFISVIADLLLKQRLTPSTNPQ